MVKENTYISIQAFMVNGLKLGGNELLTYAVIYGFSQDGESWFTGSRSYIADWCQCSVNTVSNNLAKLRERGFIEKRTKVVNGVTLNDYRVTPESRGCGSSRQQSDGPSEGAAAPCGDYQKLVGGLPISGGGGLPKIDPQTIEKDNLEDKEDIYTDSSPRKPIRHRYGEYGNVLLTDGELSKLKDEFPDYRERIETLSEYIASTGKRYKSHLATIRSWARREKKDEPKAEKWKPAVQISPEERLRRAEEEAAKWGML